MSDRHTLDEIRSTVPMARIEIVLYENGMVRVEGQITDKDFALSMLNSARDVVNNYHARKKLGMGDAILIPGGDTPLAGTPAETRLLNGSTS